MPMTHAIIDRILNLNFKGLKELQGVDRNTLRLILRSHTERKFAADDRDMNVRRELDLLLDALTYLELAYEAGLIDGNTRDPFIAAGLETPIPALQDLMESDAFARYLNSYLYIGVRFFAHRTKAEMRPSLLKLTHPPSLSLISDRLLGADEAFEKYTALHSSFVPSNLVPSKLDVASALGFLDDMVEYPNEQLDFQLWLRGLYANDPRQRWLPLASGLIEWAKLRAEFYLDLEDKDRVQSWFDERWVEGKWIAKNPLSARFGIADLYWIARILGAEITPAGTVTFGGVSWLDLLAASSAALNLQQNEVLRAKDVLRSVLDITCDLIQNAHDITTEDVEAAERKAQRRDGKVHIPPDATADWRTTRDDELEEIALQRIHRKYEGQQRLQGQGARAAQREPQGYEIAARVSQLVKQCPEFVQRMVGRRQSDTSSNLQEVQSDQAAELRWSRRVRTGEYVEDLVGLAMSGGGIRSATFGLGVLQRLQELDLLRHVDFLSTVSGGGYIGAWLVGNVRRKPYWLSRLTDWNSSVQYLRRYSNYLAPKTGLLSADTWSILGTWCRNAVLIQLTTIVWIAFAFLLVLASKHGFDGIGRGQTWPTVFLVAVISFVTWFICRSFRQAAGSERRALSSEKAVVAFAVAPVWILSFFVAARLWAEASNLQAGALSIQVLREPRWFLPLSAITIGFAVVSHRFIDDWQGKRRSILALLIGLFCVAAFTLQTFAIQFVFRELAKKDPMSGAWYAFVAGAPAVQLASSLSVVLMIGLVGKLSKDWRREWWTRFGAWLGILGLAVFVITVIAVMGPFLVLKLFEPPFTTFKWSAILGWLGTLVSGLIAGNSSATKGDGEQIKARAVGLVAKVSAFIFILGALISVSTLLHVAQLKLWTNRAFTSADYWVGLDAVLNQGMAVTAFVLFLLGVIFSWRFDINIFGLNQFYRNRLVRCYLGATHQPRPDPFTGFDGEDDIHLTDLRYSKDPEHPFPGPLPIVNCALNLGGSSDLSVHTRRSASFSLTPLRCGSSRTLVGYAPTGGNGTGESYAGGVTLGQAISVSGAAANPNMGYHTSGLVAFLLTSFNVRLGWWFPNPGKRRWNRASLRSNLYYLVKEFFGLAHEQGVFVNVSDGGHFENLGIYELVRRQCKVIIACDAECDSDLSFGSLGSMIRMCETDFGVKIHLDVASIRKQEQTKKSQAHCAIGRIQYSNGSQGYLIYLKASITGDEDVGIEQYRVVHPDFPHETTADQFFAEDQFESYRRLGHHVALKTFRGTSVGEHPVIAAGELFDRWAPSSFTNAAFLTHTKTVEELWERFRTDSELTDLLRELTDGKPGPNPLTQRELCTCLEMIQLMENVYLDLQLDDYWDHPDNRGWVVAFSQWARSRKFRETWERHHRVFGIRFEYFCNQRLGLSRDHPVVRA